MDLFAETEERNRHRLKPLAERMRPTTLADFVGQEHFLGAGKLLRRMIEADRIQSVLFYGPPGVGKTSLARLIASSTKSHFVSLNAADSATKEVRQILESARDRASASGQRTLLFLDEIHHFNRSQQDILLPDVESGNVVLIGATTQNPFFAINAPLVSRSQVFTFESLSQESIKKLLRKAIGDSEKGFGSRKIEVHEEALEHWASYCDGDARRALFALEIAVLSFPIGVPIVLDRQVAEDSIQRKALVHDGTGDQHYDLASALIKSMRGSDPDAAIYWLARMLEAGEEIRFIARRLVIFASEDIGCADPMSLVVATSTQQAIEFVGLPECQLSLAQAVIHLASAPKSNASMKALEKAKEDVREGRTPAVPRHLKDSHYPGAAKLGSGDGYLYPHDFPGGIVPQEYLPGVAKYYFPTDNGRERAIKEHLATLARLKGIGELPKHDRSQTEVNE